MINRLLGLFGNKERADNIVTHDPFLPKEVRYDDIYIVSFPKSGNTWILFILANMMVEKLKLDMEVNLFNIHGFVPDVQAYRDIPIDMGYFPFKRMMKSHSGFHPQYNYVLYLIRDPRSVMVSYHKFMTGLGHYEGDISGFLRDERFGVTAWVNHVNGWLANTSPATRFRIIRYEDFKANPEESLDSLGGLLGFRRTGEELARILRKTSLQQMKELEERTASMTYTRFDKNFRFVREGKVDGWRSELGIDDVSYIKSVAGELMSRFGYE